MTGTADSVPTMATAASGPLHRVGFDRAKYIDLQSRHIHERREQIGGKLYLEMGGKLFDDLHASRVLPGFTPDNKIAMLERLKDELEILVCLNAKDLERQKVRADLGIPYEEDVLRLVDVFRERGFLVQHVVLTQLEDSNQVALSFAERLERLGLTVFAEVSAPEQSADWQARFAEVIADIPEVMEAHQLAGSHDYALRIVVRDMGGFERIRSRITEAIPVRGLSASFALKRIKSETVLPIDTRSA